MKVNVKYILKAFIVAFLFIFSGVITHLYVGNEYLDVVLEIISYVIILAILVQWFVRIYNTVVQKRIKKYLLLSSLLTIFWHMIRVVKWCFANNIVTQRYLWYLYYVAIIFLPLLSVFVALCVGKDDSYKIPNFIFKLIIPATFLLLLVLTNDLHQLVFIFNSDVLYTDTNYSWNIGYYLIAFWAVTLTICSLIVLYKRCKIPNSRQRILLPFVFVLIIIVYCAFYPVFSDLFFYKCFDLTTVFCGFVYGIWNICCTVGLINTNTNYEKLFANSSINALITDDFLNTVYSSENIINIPKNNLLNAKSNTYNLTDNLLLKSKKINGGYVYWTEDISKINAILLQLKEDRLLLKDREEVLNADIKVKEEKAKIEKKLQLYNKIYEGLNSKFASIDMLFSNVNDRNYANELKTICLLCVYIKRRCNLLLLTENKEYIDIRELSLSIKETLVYLSFFNIKCSLNTMIEDMENINSVISVYDQLQEFIENNISNISVLYLVLKKDNKFLKLNVIEESKSNSINSFSIIPKIGGEEK